MEQCVIVGPLVASTLVVYLCIAYIETWQTFPGNAKQVTVVDCWKQNSLTKYCILHPVYATNSAVFKWQPHCL